jgi:hypothetical protein
MSPMLVVAITTVALIVPAFWLGYALARRCDRRKH